MKWLCMRKMEHVEDVLEVKQENRKETLYVKYSRRFQHRTMASILNLNYSFP